MPVRISPGNDVAVSGIKVGKVTSVSLAGDSRQGERSPSTARSRWATRSLVAIKTDTVLGQKSLSVTPRRQR